MGNQSTSLAPELENAYRLRGVVIYFVFMICVDAHKPCLVWKEEELILSNHESPGILTQVVRSGDKCLLPIEPSCWPDEYYFIFFPLKTFFASAFL